jgi:hypothetical protein
MSSMDRGAFTVSFVTKSAKPRYFAGKQPITENLITQTDHAGRPVQPPLPRAARRPGRRVLACTHRELIAAIVAMAGAAAQRAQCVASDPDRAGCLLRRCP